MPESRSDRAIRSITASDIFRLNEVYVQATLTTSGCVEWPGLACADRRYGHFTLAGAVVPAHRVVLFLNTAELGEHARHRCNNPPCVNPEHLVWGTPTDNRRDRVLTESGSADYRDTHCVNGHEYNCFTIIHTPTGGKRCRLCKQAASRKHKAVGK